MRAVSVPSQLIGRRRAPARRRRLDQIGDGLGLRQIALAVEERAQRELAGLGQPGAGAHGRAHDAFEQHRVAVRADLDDILAGVGVWRVEAGGDRFIVGSRARGITTSTRDSARATRGAAVRAG